MLIGIRFRGGSGLEGIMFRGDQVDMGSGLDGIRFREDQV